MRLINGANRADVGSFAPRLAAIVAVDMVDYTRHIAQVTRPASARTLCRTATQRRSAGTGAARCADHQAHRRWVHGRVLERQPIGVVRGQVPGRRSCLECSPGARKTPRVSRRHKPGGCDRGSARRLWAQRQHRRAAEWVAAPGGVLVLHAVVLSVRDPQLVFEDAGDFALKNVDEPVRGFHARLSASARSRRSPSAARLTAA